jgi:hypothetical protein
MIYAIGSRGLKPLSHEGKDNLPIGTVLKLNGYDNPEYVIAANLGTESRYQTRGYGSKYVTIKLDDLGYGQHEAFSLKWLREKQDNRIQVYITEQVLPIERVDEIRGQADDLLKLHNELKVRQDKEVADAKELGRIQFDKLRPVWAKAIIAAVYETDACDLMTDYFNVTHGKPIFLAWSRHTRDLFAEMRSAAAHSGMPELKELAEVVSANEHREKWSMGAGYYLKAGSRYSTGWKIYKTTLYDSVISEIQLAIGEGRFKARKS